MTAARQKDATHHGIALDLLLHGEAALPFWRPTAGLGETSAVELWIKQ